MKIETIILFCLLALIVGLICGLVISVFHYPKWEVRKVLKHMQKDGYKLGAWHHVKEFVDHHVKVIVKPNCETLYSLAFISRKDGPYVLKMPVFENYYSFAFLNENTDVMGYFTNNDKSSKHNGEFLIYYDNIDMVDLDLPKLKIDSKLCWIIGRFGIEKTEDIVKVNQLQDQLQLIKLQDYTKAT